MPRNFRSRRRPRYGVFVCGVVSGLLVLASLCLLYSGIIWHSRSHEVNYDSLVSDSANDDASGDEDIIDALDVWEEQSEDPMDGMEEDDPLDQENASGYFFHQVEGVIRRAMSKSSMEEEGILKAWEDRGKSAFGSDDVSVEEKVRTKAIEVKGVEDALLLKTNRRVSPLREGWGDWFNKKSDFLRKDKMFNLEGLNPSFNPILQDPDNIGLTGITKADKIIRNSLLNEFKRVPFPASTKKDPNFT
ncbi:hypothetical protein VNO77_35886 [Canavalia gladiata]|uniref:Uncharacterized protein n=1 Tax=Canavalia gladiata TaxID=3824 RepID=A0AAN9PU14_CANGL